MPDPATIANSVLSGQLPPRVVTEGTVAITPEGKVIAARFNVEGMSSHELYLMLVKRVFVAASRLQSEIKALMTPRSKSLALPNSFCDITPGLQPRIVRDGKVEITPDGRVVADGFKAEGLSYHGLCLLVAKRVFVAASRLQSDIQDVGFIGTRYNPQGNVETE